MDSIKDFMAIGFTEEEAKKLEAQLASIVEDDDGFEISIFSDYDHEYFIWFTDTLEKAISDIRKFGYTK